MPFRLSLLLIGKFMKSCLRYTKEGTGINQLTVSFGRFRYLPTLAIIRVLLKQSNEGVVLQVCRNLPK